MAQGILTTELTGLPDNIDLTALNVYRTRDGFGYGEVIQAAGVACREFGAFNWIGQEETSSLIQALVAPSADDSISWRVGDLTAVRVTQDNLADIGHQHRDRAGSQIPIYGDATSLGGYTWATTQKGPKALSSDEVMTDIRASMDALINSFFPEFLRSLTYKAARAVPGSSSGQAVGWLGATSSDYVATSKKGRTFSGHSHYLTDAAYADSANGRRALFAAFSQTLLEHGKRHSSSAPLLLLHGSASKTDVMADSQWAAPTVVGVVPGANTAQVTDVPFWAYGKLQDSGACTVDVGSLLPEHYYVFVKSYGPLSILNPLRLCYPESTGFGPLVIDRRSGFPVDGNTPKDGGLLNNMVAILNYGLAVRDPEAGAAGLIGGGGSWTDPTIA